MEETWYHNMSEENKQRLKEYQKNYHEVKKKNLSFFLFIGKNGARSYLFRRKWHHKTCFSLK